jgi:hypothetical protein
MKKRIRKKPWPRMEFRSTGTKLQQKDPRIRGLGLSEEHIEFLLWRNGGIPQHRGFSLGRQDMQIKRFLGIGTEWDLVDSILEFRNVIPRWSVPIAEVENGLGDFAFLLVFPFHPIEKTFDEPGVWYYTWFHEEYPKNPDDKRSIKRVADSIRDLVHGLFPNEL